MNKNFYGAVKCFCIQLILFYIQFVGVFGRGYIFSIDQSFIHRARFNFLRILLSKIVYFLAECFDWSKLFLLVWLLIFVLFLLLLCLFLFCLLLLWLICLDLELVGIFGQPLHCISCSLDVLLIFVDIVIKVYVLEVLSQCPFSNTICMEIELICLDVLELFLNKIKMSQASCQIPQLQERFASFYNIPLILQLIQAGFIPHEQL